MRTGKTAGAPGPSLLLRGEVVRTREHRLTGLLTPGFEPRPRLPSVRLPVAVGGLLPVTVALPSPNLTGFPNICRWSAGITFPAVQRTPEPLRVCRNSDKSKDENGGK